MSNNSALLVIDMQEGIARDMNNIDCIIDKNIQAISIARSHNIPVIFVVTSFESNFLDISSNNKFFTMIKDSGAPLTKEELGTRVLKELNPHFDEPIISKNRISAFVGNKLDILLRSMEINHLILAGVATSGTILSTALESADKDYVTTVLSDATDDPIPNNHQFLITQILATSSNIKTIQEWENSIN
ncbi:cysteine hydrolase [Staphylococcus epidermidis]|nr:cysteine hydrolase [Staphylococcus epidermidis]